MHANQVLHIAEAATNLRRSRPQAPAIDVLDFAFGGHAGDRLRFPSDVVAPPSPFGQLIAEAFDRDMPAGDWVDWAGPDADPLVRDALLRVWHDEVLPSFCARYGVGIG